MSAPAHQQQVHIASLLVQCHPEKLSGVRSSIEAMQEAEIHGCDPRGKLIVTLEISSEATLKAHLDSIGRLSGVLAASLVYHQVEPA